MFHWFGLPPHKPASESLEYPITTLQLQCTVLKITSSRGFPVGHQMIFGVSHLSTLW
jgi:hypothetical protein